MWAASGTGRTAGTTGPETLPQAPRIEGGAAPKAGTVGMAANRSSTGSRRGSRTARRASMRSSQLVRAATSLYIVAFEHTTVSVNGSPSLPYTLRATTVFRRENGEWKVVHRHADPVASENAAELLQRLVVTDA
jgi:hypothetical protein